LTTIAQSIKDLSERLESLTYPDGSKVYENVYYGVCLDSSRVPCALISPSMFRSWRITSCIPLSDDFEQIEKQAIALHDVLYEKFGVRCGLEWLREQGQFYCTLTFYSGIPKERKADATI